MELSNNGGMTLSPLGELNSTNTPTDPATIISLLFSPFAIQGVVFPLINYLVGQS